MENSNIKIETTPATEQEVKRANTKEKLVRTGKKAKILFDIVILLIAFSGVIISCMNLDSNSFLSILAFIFPMIMYVWAILNRILDIYKQVN